MFQYAFARALSFKQAHKVFLDNRNYLKSNYREFLLDKFNTELEILKMPCLPFKKGLLKLFFPNEYEENIFVSYDKNAFKQSGNTYFTSHFGSHYYFDFIRSLLIEDFSLKESLDSKNLKILEKIKNQNSVSIHVRRGDYLKIENYGVLPLNYYLLALDEIKNRTEQENFTLFVFSNDINWCKENFNFPYETIFVENDEKHCLFDLELMKNCKHNIIANSTFSWWGAYLNQNNEKIVTVPEPWFKLQRGCLDLIPPEWIKIEY